VPVGTIRHTICGTKMEAIENVGEKELDDYCRADCWLLASAVQSND